MVDKFIELFTGYQGDFGIADMSSAQLDTDKNKLKPNYEWAGRPITQGDYRDHIEGKISIGIQPCRLDKTVQFGCIDIDSKDCLLYTSPSPRDGLLSRMPSSA